LVQPGMFITFNEDGFEPQILAKFDIRKGIADDQAGSRIYLSELSLRLLEEARQRLAAVTLPLVMRTEIEIVDMRAVLQQFHLQLVMDGDDIRSGIKSQRNAALVGHNQDSQSGLIELANSVRHAGEQFKVLPAGDVLTLRHFAVDDAVAVKKDSLEIRAEIDGLMGVGFSMQHGAFWRDLHPAMIAIS